MFSRQVFLENSKFLAPQKNLPKRRRIGMLGSVSPKIRGAKKKIPLLLPKTYTFPPQKKERDPKQISLGDFPKKTDPLKQLRVDSALEVNGSKVRISGLYPQYNPPGTHMGPLVLIGVWAFFWRVPPPKQRTFTGSRHL